MNNPDLRNALMRLLWRCDPLPVMKRTAASEMDIALSAPVSTAEFDEALAALRDEGLLRLAQNRLLGETVLSLTREGIAECQRAFG